MKLQKKQVLWYVNLGLFGVVFLLAVTGGINWLILPRGSETDVGVLISLRHLIRELHEWCGLIFICLSAVHIYLHKEYVLVNIKKLFGQRNP